jgi:DNA-binding transcriptional MerR regulator/effector-binding domain-containing protein
VFRVGEFAHLGQVSVRTLHHYHHLGLLKPALTDPSTGYRLYAAAQLVDLNRILAMRDLGFSLAEIAELLDRAADLAPALVERRCALDDEITRLETRRRTIDRRLALAESGVDHDLVLRSLPAQYVAALRSPPRADGDVSELFVELEEHVGAHRARAPRPPLMLYHCWGDRTVDDVEVVVPIDADVPATRRITIGWLPAVNRALCLIHRGPYRRLGQLRATFAAWLTDRGGQTAGPLREVFVRFAAEPHLDLPARYLTERSDELVTEYQVPLHPTG